MQPAPPIMQSDKQKMKYAVEASYTTYEPLQNAQRPITTLLLRSDQSCLHFQICLVRQQASEAFDETFTFHWMLQPMQISTCKRRFLQVHVICIMRAKKHHSPVHLNDYAQRHNPDQATSKTL